jgi:uncharacterized protein (TIGR02145 family)
LTDFCNYDNDETNAKTYGRLYDWHAVNDMRGLAPEGWHIPTDSEFKQLEMFLGMSQAEADGSGWRGPDEGGKLKETGLVHWTSRNKGATNEISFTALPAGYRYIDGRFLDMGDDANIWTSSENNDLTAWYRYMTFHHSEITRNNESKGSYACPVRCIMDQ